MKNIYSNSKLLPMHRMYHPKSDVNKLFFPRKEGGRGLVQLELSLKTSVVKMDTYLNNANDWILKLVKNYEQKKRVSPITQDTKKYLNELTLALTTFLKILYLRKKTS